MKENSVSKRYFFGDGWGNIRLFLKRILWRQGLSELWGPSIWQDRTMLPNQPVLPRTHRWPSPGKTGRLKQLCKSSVHLSFPFNEISRAFPFLFISLSAGHLLALMVMWLAGLWPTPRPLSQRSITSFLACFSIIGSQKNSTWYVLLLKRKLHLNFTQLDSKLTWFASTLVSSKFPLHLSAVCAD